MLDRFTNWVKEISDSLSNDVKKIKNKKFLEAVVAGCAMVAAADGHVSAEEKQKMIGFISQNEALKVYDTSQIIELFQKFIATYDFDAEVAKGQALKALAPLKSNPEEARLMIRVCCAIGAADGNFDTDERAVVTEICRELGQEPADFNL